MDNSNETQESNQTGAREFDPLIQACMSIATHTQYTQFVIATSNIKDPVLIAGLMANALKNDGSKMQ